MRKIIKKKSLLVGFLFITFLLLLLLLLFRDIHLYGYTDYGRYEGFNQVKKDFNIMAQYFIDSGKGLYYLYDDGVSKLSDSLENDLSDIERNALVNVQENSVIKGVRDGFDSVEVSDEYVFFIYGDTGSGILYTEKDISDIIKRLEERSIYKNEHYGSIKYGDGWYGVYR